MEPSWVVEVDVFLSFFSEIILFPRNFRRMSFSHVIQTFKMFYKLLVYLFGALTIVMNILWFCCTIASAAIPWLTLLFIVVCVGSKFMKLKTNYGCVMSMLGPDPNKIAEDNLKCGYLYWAVANRGGSYDAPENSVEAVKKVSSSSWYTMFAIV